MKNAFERQLQVLNAMPGFIKAFMGICLLVASYSFLGFLGITIATMATGLPSTSFTGGQYQNGSAGLAAGLKIIQFFLDIGLFVIPALLLPLLVYGRNPVSFMGMTKKSALILFIIAIGMALCIQPIVDLCARLNQSVIFPHFLAGVENYIREQENKNEGLMKQFLNMPHVSDFIINIILVAIMPAVVEELFFRGFVQKSLQLWLKRDHLAVFLAAFIFSFIHFEFYGFIPRLLLGMLLGYAYLWTGDIKLPILIHFVNNFLGLAQAYSLQLEGKPASPDVSITAPSLSVWLYIGSAFFMLILLYLYKTRAQTSNHLETNENNQNEQH